MNVKTLNDKIALEALDWLTDKTNRSINQTRFLFELVGFDWYLLLELEEALSGFIMFYCPADLATALYWVGKYRIWKAMNWETPYKIKKLL